MRIHPMCPSCLLNRAYVESRFVTDDEDLIFKAVGEALKVLANRYFTRGINAHIATEMHRRVYEVLGVEDPYREVKEKANRVAMENLPVIKAFVENQKDVFKSSAVASIIANTFDYGVMGHEVEDEDFLTFFIREFKRGLKIDDLDEIRELCRGKVCYLTDNCGEIVIDTLFMREIKKICERLTVVVRGKPIISDATLEDALAVGVDTIAAELLTNGKGAIRITEDELPNDTLERLESADVIIAKGMANYESLSESRFKPIAFLLKAKCLPVARDVGVDVGDMVAMLRR